MSRINVLWVIDHVCYDGSLHGGGRLYWNVLPQLNGDRCHVVPCLLRATEPIRQLFANSPVPVRILSKGKYDPTTLWTILRLLREENIHAMHLHCYGASTFGRLAGRIAGVPTVIQDYDTEVYFPYPWYLSFFDRALAPSTSAAIAASPMVQHFLTARRKIDRQRIRMMFHAVPPEKYLPVAADRVAAVRIGLGANAKTKIVGTVTKLGPQRGNEYLLDAAAQVLRDFPDALFLLIYKNTYFHRLPNRKYVQVPISDTARMATELKTRAREMGIDGKIRFIEWPEDLDALMAACDLMVAPFLSERFSSANLLEAMAMGKPLIVTDIGEAREVVKEGINGYRVPAGDAGELARRILKVVGDPVERDRLSRQSRCESEQYSVAAYARKLEDLYADLARRSPAPELRARKEFA